MSARKKPNILLITADQHRGDCFGFEGRNISTPHLDRMASKGTRFSTCITPCLVCAPARASILTGLLPLTHGVADNGIDLDEEIGKSGFAGHLRQHGYRTGIIGKAHFSTYHTFEPTGRLEDRNSTAFQDGSWNGSYMGFDEVDLVLAGHNFFPSLEAPYGLHYEDWYERMGGSALDEAYIARVRPDAGAAQTHHSGLPPAYHNSTWVADRTISFLGRNTEEPFCLWTSFPDPHHPFDCPAPWSLLHAPENVDLPAHRKLDLDKRPWWHRASLEGTPEISNAFMKEFRAESSRVLTQTDEQLREMMANYYGMISLIDHNVGRILLALQEQGLHEDTIVIYTSDHGDLLGDHGLYLKGPTAYDGLLRVGMIAAGPGIPQGTIVNEPVSLLDLAATFYDYAGATQPNHIHSQSLRPLIESPVASRDFALNEWKLNPSRSGIGLDLRTVRTKTHRLSVDLISGDGELYDFSNDPYELENRWDDPQSQSVRADLMNMVHSRPDDYAPEQTPVGMA